MALSAWMTAAPASGIVTPHAGHSGRGSPGTPERLRASPRSCGPPAVYRCGRSAAVIHQGASGGSVRWMRSLTSSLISVSLRRAASSPRWSVSERMPLAVSAGRAPRNTRKHRGHRARFHELFGPTATRRSRSWLSFLSRVSSCCGPKCPLMMAWKRPCHPQCGPGGGHQAIQHRALRCPQCDVHIAKVFPSRCPSSHLYQRGRLTGTGWMPERGSPHELPAAGFTSCRTTIH